MKSANLNRYKSWLLSGGIVIVVVLWLASGQFSRDEPETVGAIEPAAAPSAQRNAVRVRTQTAEEVMRTIVVNGETAPSRVVNLAAETDGRVEYIGAERGASLERGDVIVRLDKRDRSARLAQAEALVRRSRVRSA
jgi:multidrug efflux system membrane fusion protein